LQEFFLPHAAVAKQTPSGVYDPQEYNGDHNCLERHPTSARAELIGCGTMSFNTR
jgi:hypothetical protein